MMMFAPLLAAALAVSATAQSPARAAPESITYRVGPCFGACASYSFTVRADGTGVFEGVSGRALLGRHTIRITRAQYQAFARHLAPLRPSRGNAAFAGADRCGGIRSDQAHTIVTWRPARGPAQELNYSHGCVAPNVAGIQQRLRSAPGLLPIARFIRERPLRRCPMRRTCQLGSANR